MGYALDLARRAPRCAAESSAGNEDVHSTAFLTAARTAAHAARRRGPPLVQRQHLAVAHQHPAVHDRRPHVVAARDVDEVRDRIVHRRLPRRCHRHDDQSRRACRLERSDARRSSPARARRESSPSRARPAPESRAGRRSQLVQQRRHASPRTCRGRCCWPPRRCRGRRRRRPPDRLGTGACRSPASCCSRDCARRRRRALQDRDVRRRHPDAVRRQRPGPQKPSDSRGTRPAHLEALLRRFDLVLRLGEMDQRRHAVTPPARGRLQRRPSSVYIECGATAGGDQRVARELLDERAPRAPARRPASWRRPPGTG